MCPGGSSFSLPPDGTNPPPVTLAMLAGAEIPDRKWLRSCSAPAHPVFFRSCSRRETEPAVKQTCQFNRIQINSESVRTCFCSGYLILVPSP